MYDVLIPTNKAKEALYYYKEMIRHSNNEVDNIFISAKEKCSASTNRNICLYSSDSKYVVMIDDDLYRITGYELDKLVDNFIKKEEEDNAVLASARLLKPDKSFGVMMNLPLDIHIPQQIVKENMIPTACIVFNLDKIKQAEIFFDEGFIGSGWEDNDFCLQIKKAYPNGTFYIDNTVKVIHLNEMKNQHENNNYKINKSRFFTKWKGSLLQKKGKGTTI